MRRILIVQGHPDPGGNRYGHALAAAYARGAKAAGHEVRELQIASLNFPLLRTRAEWQHGALPAAIMEAQEMITWADHLLLCYPLWLGTMPALLKGFLEQALRPGFAIGEDKTGSGGKKLLKGKSARIVITMGMPVLFYRWYFRAHSLKSLERNILRFCGIGPIRESLFGLVEAVAPAKREKWLRGMEKRGREGY